MSSSRASSLEALLAAGQEAEGLARARWKGSLLAHSRMTPSGDPETVYLHFGFLDFGHHHREGLNSVENLLVNIAEFLQGSSVCSEALIVL